MTLEEFISLKEFGDCSDMFPIVKLILVFINEEEVESHKTVSWHVYKHYLKHEIRRIESTVCFDRGGSWYDCDEYFDIFLYAEEEDKEVWRKH